MFVRALQAMLLTDASEKLDPMSLLFYMSSFSVLLLLPTTIALEPGAFAQVGGQHDVAAGLQQNSGFGSAGLQHGCILAGSCCMCTQAASAAAGIANS